MPFVRQRPPEWFWLVATMLTIWGLVGCAGFALHLLYGADAMGHASAYDRAFYRHLPDWYQVISAVAVGSAAAGGLAMLKRSLAARALFIASLAAIVVRFGWLFLGTNLLAVKGLTIAMLPAVGAVVGVYAIWLSLKAQRHGWIC